MIHIISANITVMLLCLVPILLQDTTCCLWDPHEKYWIEDIQNPVVDFLSSKSNPQSISLKSIIDEVEDLQMRRLWWLVPTSYCKICLRAFQWCSWANTCTDFVDRVGKLRTCNSYILKSTTGK